MAIARARFIGSLRERVSRVWVSEGQQTKAQFSPTDRNTLSTCFMFDGRSSGSLESARRTSSANALTGVRRGELWALRSSDIDLERRKLNVERSKTPNTNRIKSTKTHEQREVDLSPGTTEMLEAYLAWSRQWCPRTVSMLNASSLT